MMNSSRGVSAFVLFTLVAFALGNVFLHAPRGSRNRNCERNEYGNNGNRLFDSQSNAAGGYACPRAVGGPETVTPRMYYYTSSKLLIEWSNHLGCGNSDSNCEIILQYMCSDSSKGIRDGEPTNTMDSATDSLTTANKDSPRQGSHETHEWYEKCQIRERNQGLFTADVSLRTPTSMSTRQNPAGGKHGWECPEERDYYPYWHPTPWRDIAVFTNNVTRCDYYQKESQNVQSKGECYSGTTFLKYNNPTACTANSGTWKVSGSWGTKAPECLKSPVNKANAQAFNSYLWTIPDDVVDDSCVIRIRYNVSSMDYGFEVDSSFNGDYSPIKLDPVVNLGYQHAIELKMNPNQYGRTFQDRTYTFSIKKRPDNIPSTIWNLGLKGKRGNDVQTYPSVQYGFTPEILKVKPFDYVHIQWTGSDYNPTRNPNDAEGGPRDRDMDTQLRADRSNIVQLTGLGHNYPVEAKKVTMFLTPEGQPDMDLINKLAMLNQPGLTSSNPFEKCLSLPELLAKNNGNRAHAKTDIQNCMKLSNAPTPYFDAGLVQMRAKGTFIYYSTRNSNFGNRLQKGIIVVSSE